MADRQRDLQAEPRLWAEMTSPEIKHAQEEGAMVLLPVGAIEQHGPHLPVDMDICGAYETAKEVARRLPWTVVAPPVWWGLSGAHRKFPGTLTLRNDTFFNLLVDICDSLIEQGFPKIVLIVGHATNKPTVTNLIKYFAEERGIFLLQLNYINLCGPVFSRIRKSPLGGDAHAGELETSLMMYLKPGKIDPSNAPVRMVDPKQQFGISAAMQDIFNPGKVVVGYDLKQSFPEGVMGDPSVASVETGKLAFEAIVDAACGYIEEYREL